MYSYVKKNVVRIEELPIGVWTDKYKEYLEELCQSKIIRSFKNYSTTDRVHFDLMLFNGIPFDEKVLKLTSTITTSNLVLFNHYGSITKYNTVEDIMEEFCETRLYHYTLRKSHLIEKMLHEYNIHSSKLKFITEVMNDTLHLYGVEEESLIRLLTKRKYYTYDKYDYLLTLPIRTFSSQKIEELTQKTNDLHDQLQTLRSTDEKEMWSNELKQLRSKLV
jgi:DNA topoisomerase-2